MLELVTSKEVQSFRASRAVRLRLAGGAGYASDVYADRGSAAYDDAGPGIRRLSAAVVIARKVDLQMTADPKNFLPRQLYPALRSTLSQGNSK